MPSLVESGPLHVILEKIFESRSFSICHYHLPLEKGVAPFLNKNEYPFTQGKFDWNWPKGTGEKDENKKKTIKKRQLQRQTTENQESSVEPSAAQVSYKRKASCIRT